MDKVLQLKPRHTEALDYKIRALYELKDYPNLVQTCSIALGLKENAEYVREHQITDPSSILMHLNSEVHKALQQKSDLSTINDGMDMSLVAYEPASRKLTFTGAISSIFLIRKNEVQEFKGDRSPIGHLTPVTKTVYQS